MGIVGTSVDVTWMIRNPNLCVLSTVNSTILKSIQSVKDMPKPARDVYWGIEKGYENRDFTSQFRRKKQPIFPKTPYIIGVYP